MRGRRAGLALAGVALIGLAGCVTRSPVASASSGASGEPPAALPSLAASLPAGVSPAPSVPAPTTTAPATGPAATGPAATDPYAAGRATPVPAARAPGTGKTAATHVPTSAELKRALLGPGDLSGFEVDGGAGDDSGGSGCPALDTDFSGGAGARADVLLFQSSGSVFVRERLRRLSASAARAALDRVRSAPGSCSGYTTTVDPLGKVTVTVGRLGMATIGDGSVAVRITMRPSSRAVVAIENLVVIQRGDTLIILTHTALTSIDDGLTSRAAGTAYARTKQIW